MSLTARQRVLGLCIALSAGLHLALFALLATAPLPPTAPEPPPVAVEIVERTIPPRQPPPVVPPLAPPPRPTEQVRPKTPAPAPALRPAPSVPPPAGVEALAPPAEEVPRAVTLDLAHAAETSAAAASDLGGVAVRSLGMPDAGSLRGIHAPDVIADPNERVADMIGAQMGRDRVQRGLVDPYFGELSKALAKKWDVDLADHQASLASYFEHFGQNARRGLGIWQSLAANYGEGGSPLGPTDEPHGAETQQQAVQEFNAKLREAWKQTKRTLVRITQGPGGLVQRVELVQSSADPGLDAEIIRELTQGELVLPVPPTSGQGIHTPLRSVWAFSLVISISPPIPAVMGSFDEVTGKVDLRLPLDRRLYKMVELVSVD